MNRQDFTNYIHDPRMLDRGLKEDLRDLAGRYPYSSSVQVLYALLLYSGNDHEFAQQLKKSAAYATSRKKLKELIDAFQVPSLTVPAESEMVTGSASEPVPETTDPTSGLRPPASILHPPSSVPEEPVPTAHMTGEEEQETSLSREEIIEKFIREEPRISAPRVTFFTPSESAHRSSTDEAEIVSETLARLYFEQGNVAKAILIYEKLSLLFPEKSRYFAAQIQKLG
ncbi:MAG: hypothetical protein NTU98_10615 [Bacteroidetes bacterium]|nr:hypothetical protein [Bacteroidota bacterium]